MNKTPDIFEDVFGSTKVTVFKNKELGLQMQAIMNEDGSVSVNAEDTAIGLGWVQEKNGKTYVKWERINGYCKEFGFSPQVGKDDFIPESLFYRLGMKANNEWANKFQNWLALEVIPSIRKTGTYGTGKCAEKSSPTVPVAACLEAAKIMASVPDSQRYVVNILRYCFPNIEAGEPHVQTDNVVVDIPEQERPENDTECGGDYAFPFNHNMLDNYLLENNISRSSLQDMLGCSDGLVTRWCNGLCRPTRSYRIKICEVLGLPVGYFDNTRRCRRVRK